MAPGCALRCLAVHVLSQERVDAGGKAGIMLEGSQSWLARAKHEMGHETAVSSGGPGGLGEGFPTHLPWSPSHRAD